MAIYKNTPPIVTNGLVLHLDAGNLKSYTSGSTTWTDLSISQNNTLLTNNPVFDTTNQGNLIFNGTNNAASASANINLSSTNQITIEFAYRSTFTSATRVFIEHSTNYNNNNAFAVFLPNDNTGVIGYNEQNAANGYITSATSRNYNNGNWNFVQITSDRSQSVANKQRIYVNGVLDTVLSPTNQANITTNFGNFPLFIGARNLTTVPYNGNIGFIKLYNRTLSTAELAQNYNALKSRFGY